MGSLVSGIFGLANGDPTKQQEGQLGDLGTFGANNGEGDINAAQGYYGGILSGNPAEIAETLAPEISTQQTQDQQAKNNLAQFGTRSGGATSSAAGIDSAGRGNIINLIGQAQQGAAAAEAGLGTNLLSQGSSNIQADAGLKRAQNTEELGDISGIATGAAQIAAAPFTGGSSLGFGDMNLPGFGGTPPADSTVSDAELSGI
jgi:hypothetical protein